MLTDVLFLKNRAIEAGGSIMIRNKELIQIICDNEITSKSHHKYKTKDYTIINTNNEIRNIIKSHKQQSLNQISCKEWKDNKVKHILIYINSH